MGTQALQLRPHSGRLYGITHDLDGAAMVREPKILRVGIGLPKGPAVNVWIGPDKQKPWRVRVGYSEKPDKGGITNYSFATRHEAEDCYRVNIATAPVCPYPRKTPYFCFTRRIVTASGGELFEPDWYAIEAHGPAPTEIDVVFLKDNPFDAAYQMWSKSELKCKGDGLLAMRVVTLAVTPHEKELAAAAIKDGQKHFLLDVCWTNGCPFAGKDCMVGADLTFQLARNIRVGGTAYFHTTSVVSASRIFSSLHAISALTGGRLAMVPMKMIVRPWRSNHDGQPSTQHAISLEFRAQDVESLMTNLIQQAANFRKIAEGNYQGVKMIDAGDDSGIEDEEVDAAMMDAEFSEGEPEAKTEGKSHPVIMQMPINTVPSAMDPQGSPAATAMKPTTAPATGAATATQEKTKSLAQKIKDTKAKIAPCEDEPTTTAAPTTTTTPAPKPVATGDLF